MSYHALLDLELRSYLAANKDENCEPRLETHALVVESRFCMYALAWTVLDGSSSIAVAAPSRRWTSRRTTHAISDPSSGQIWVKACVGLMVAFVAAPSPSIVVSKARPCSNKALTASYLDVVVSKMCIVIRSSSSRENSWA